jgi:hypothetical protein
MIHHSRIAALAVLLCTCAEEGGGGSAASPSTAVAPTFSDVETKIFAPLCAFGVCHGGSRPQEGLSLAPGSAYEAIVGVASAQVPSRLRVAPRDPAASYLLEKLDHPRPAAGQQMPPNQPLTAAQIAAIREWIRAGASRD